MINMVVLIGRLTKDPVLRFIPGSGIPVVSFTLAVDRNFTNQQGVREADFIPIVAWRKLAEICANNLTKGRLVAVTGRIQTRNWDDQEGKRHFVTEVVADNVRFLDWGSNSKQGYSVTQDSDIDRNLDSLDGFVPVEGEDELPF